MPLPGGIPCRTMYSKRSSRESMSALDCGIIEELIRQRGAEDDEAKAFVALLRACTKSRDLRRGSSLHGEIVERGLLEKCSDALVTMYAKCSALDKAKALLDMYKSRDVMTWTAVIAGYCQRGQGLDALKYFESMRHEGLSPDVVTYTCILTACGSIRAADKGKIIHDEIAKHGLLGNNLILGNALLNMYAKCAALSRARQVLEELPVRDVVSWNTLLAGYVDIGEGEEALNCFRQMQFEGLSPDRVTFICILKACGILGADDEGRKVHDEIAKQGLLESDIMIGNAVVNMYAKLGALAKARQVLNELAARDVITWNALLAGCVEHGEGKLALGYYELMQHEGTYPDVVTYTCILRACGIISEVDKGKNIHHEISKQGLLGKHIVLGNAIVDMYAKFGALSKAQQVLEELPGRDVITWNALVTGYAEHGQGEQVLDCFERMQREGVSPDSVTFICLLKACGSIRASDRGEKILDLITKQGTLRLDIILGTAVVDMYAKCGALAKAREVLEELPARNAIAWTALISGYADNYEGEEALNCFERMQHEGLFPNAVTFACVLKACGSIGAVDKGEKIHEKIAKQGLFGSDVVLGTAVVDMYAKCGALAKARRVHQELPVRTVVSWNALIAGYAEQCNDVAALNCLNHMQREGVSPDAATFSCMLSACSHLGLLEDAQLYLASMSTNYGIEPDLEHYACMIDLFGRAGHLCKAVDVIEKMRCTGIVQYVLLGACRNWGGVHVGRWAFDPCGSG